MHRFLIRVNPVTKKLHKNHETFRFPPFFPPRQPAPPPNTNGHFSVSTSMKLLVAHPIAEPAPPTLGASSRFRLRHAMSNPRGHGLTEPESRVRPLCGLCDFTNHPRCHQNIIVSARRINDDTKNGVRTAPPPSDAVPTRQRRRAGPG